MSGVHDDLATLRADLMSRVEAEIARLEALAGMLPDDEWKLTLEKVEPHGLCCAECKQARESLAHLEEGLREIGLEAVSMRPDVDHIGKMARSLLADQGGAA